MIVLDTNVISELLRAQADAQVLEWLAAQSRAVVYTTAITQAEVLYGLRVMPDGRRKSALEEAVRLVFREEFSGRLLPFDSTAAEAFSCIAAERRRTGQPISQFDAQIAAIVRCRDATLATRNVRDFVDCGIAVVDPWEGR